MEEQFDGESCFCQEKNTNRDFYRDYKYICKDVDKEISCELELIRRVDVFLDHISQSKQLYEIFEKSLINQGLLEC